MEDQLERLVRPAAATGEVLHADLVLLQDRSPDPSRVRVVEHRAGPAAMSAVSSGIALATGDVTIVQASGLECDAGDLPSLLGPVLSGEADAVFGSRRSATTAGFLRAAHRQQSGLELADVASRTQAVGTRLLQSIPL